MSNHRQTASPRGRLCPGRPFAASPGKKLPAGLRTVNAPAKLVPMTSTPTMQTLILDRLIERLNAAGVPVAVDFSYANCGTVRVIDPDTLLAVATVTFDFQKDRCGFDVDSRTPVACHYYGQPRGVGAIEAVKSTPGEVIDAVVVHLVAKVANG